VLAYKWKRCDQQRTSL